MKPQPAKVASIIQALFGILFFLIVSNISWAGCSVHDHNCLHGAYPLDPLLGTISSGTSGLEVNTTYDNAPNVDIDQHIAIPLANGPFVASLPDGSAIKATPVGSGVNVIFHEQQRVQFQNGTVLGSLVTTPSVFSPTAPGRERTFFEGNIPEGTYDVGLYNYDKNATGSTGSYNTIGTATGTGHFDAPSASHINQGFVQEITIDSGTLAVGQSSISDFTYYNNGYNPHAQGVYVIPDGVWNIGGIQDAVSASKIGSSSPLPTFVYIGTQQSTSQAARGIVQHLRPVENLYINANTTSSQGLTQGQVAALDHLQNVVGNKLGFNVASRHLDVNELKGLAITEKQNREAEQRRRIEAARRRLNSQISASDCRPPDCAIFHHDLTSIEEDYLDNFIDDTNIMSDSQLRGIYNFFLDEDHQIEDPTNKSIRGMNNAHRHIPSWMTRIGQVWSSRLTTAVFPDHLPGVVPNIRVNEEDKDYFSEEQRDYDEMMAEANADEAAAADAADNADGAASGCSCGRI